MADKLGDKLSSVDWDKILLEPQKDWYSKSCPVVKETVIGSDGQMLEQKLARVSPAHKVMDRFPPHKQFGRVVTLDYEVGPDNVSTSTADVEVKDLKSGGWTGEAAGTKHTLEFQGFTKDEGYKDKKWSNTF